MVLDNQEALGLALIEWLKARGERVVEEAGPEHLPAGTIIVDFRAIGTSAIPGLEDQAARRLRRQPQRVRCHTGNSPQTSYGKHRR